MEGLFDTNLKSDVRYPLIIFIIHSNLVKIMYK